MSAIRLVAVTLASAVQLNACAAPPSSEPQVRQAKALQIHKGIETKAGWARAFLQRGVVQGYGDFDRYYPYCYLELSLVQDQAQTILAGTAQIRSVSVQFEEVVNAGTRLAGLRWADGGDVSDQTQMLIFTLESERQPELRRLVCGGAFDVPSRAAAPSWNDIAVALGDYASLR